MSEGLHKPLIFLVFRAESIAACDNDRHVLRPCSVYAWRIGCTTTPPPPPHPRYSCCTTTPPLFPPLLHSSTSDPYLVLFFLFFSSYSASWYTSLLLNSSSSFANHVFVLRTPFHEVVKKAIFRFGTENGEAHLTRTPHDKKKVYSLPRKSLLRRRCSFPKCISELHNSDRCSDLER